MSDGTLLHPYLNGIGNSNAATTSLPIQTIPDSEKKKEDWQKRVMDALESIGIRQLSENAHFRDYYKMINGTLVYSDFGIDEDSILDQVRGLGDNVGIPTFLKHYDRIGIIT